MHWVRFEPVAFGGLWRPLEAFGGEDFTHITKLANSTMGPGPSTTSWSTRELVIRNYKTASSARSLIARLMALIGLLLLPSGCANSQ